MKKITLSLVAFTLLFISTYAQQTLKSDVNNLLNIQGEVTFLFHVNDEDQLKDFTTDLTIVNFNSETNQVKAWANKEQFTKFLTHNISYTISKDDNDIDQRLMSNNVSHYSKNLKPGYTLEFPLKYYPTYNDYAAQMQNFEDEHSDIVDFFSIGSTTQGDKEILFVKISDNVKTDETEPKLLYTSSMHGDELAGFPLMLNLIDYFISAYKDQSHPDHARIAKLINGSEIWINPNANPDGTYHKSPDNTSVTYARRGNSNNVDLNRNYPDYLKGAHPDGELYQKETLLFMELAETHNFIISANFHGGSELVNYPWDNTYDRHPDDAWWNLVAKEYRDNVQNDGTLGYMDDQNNGITNGADWYLIYGSRQDYMNYNHHCKEMTVELSQIKKPHANQLDKLWHYNKKALLDYLTQGFYGFSGLIKDAFTDEPIEGTIKIVNHDEHGSWSVSSNTGDFYRPIYAGKYDLVIESPNYQPIMLINQSIDNFETVALGDIKMTPIMPTANEAVVYNSNVDSKTNNLELEDIALKLNDKAINENSRPTNWLNIINSIQLFK